MLKNQVCDKSLNYCLVIPRLTEVNEQTYMFPVGIAYVSSSLKATKRQVFTLNLNYKKGSLKDLLEKFIVENNIQVVATGGLTAQYKQIRDILKAVVQINPQIVKVVGGGIITSDPDAGMDALELADYGIIGEGEITMQELADALEEKRELTTVNGLIYRENSTWKVTNPRAEIDDLDSLPYPDYEAMEYEKLLDRMSIDIWGSGKNRMGYISLSRSCPFNCTFCFHPSGTRYRKRSMKSVFKEIDFLIEKFHIQNLSIEDELFVSDKQDLKEFCREVKKRQIGFVIQLRVDMVNRELLLMLRDAGCLSISFGLESADNRILDSMRKHITIDQIEQALAICYDIGLNIVGNFIFGDQAETVETYQNTLKWWRDHPEYPILLHAITVYPGSELYKVACKRGIIKDRVDFIRKGCPYINISKLTDEEYKKMLLTISMATKKTDLLDEVSLSYSGCNKVSLSALCPHCQHKNTWEGLDAFRNLGIVSCEHCHHSLYIVASNYIGNLAQDNFSKLKNCKVGFWPMIASVGEICKAVPEVLTNPDVYFIDLSPMKFGVIYRGKKINYPSIIEDQQLDTIFLTTGTPFLALEIIDTIKQQYPSVKRVFFAGDLADRNFSKNYSNQLSI